MEELLSKWEEIKLIVYKEHKLTEMSYNTWLKPLQIFSVKKNLVVILIPSDQAQFLKYIKEKFELPIKVAIAETFGKEYDIEFILEKDASSINHEAENNVNKGAIERANLNSKYTFDTFVVASNNKLAAAAALAVAESPGEVYNPLFLYSGVGLGKTHLMHAIAHMIIENDPTKKVIYVTSEQFTNEVIETIRIGNTSPTAMTKFREKYRNIDVLLIDDIQFIIGKDSTQEEFFHTFNQLHEEKKQIIISSDKPPRDMTQLEERYKSRFGWGLIVDMQSPDYETRMAILQKKIDNDGYHIDEEVVQYIANNIKSNIRELEGALTKLIALSKLENKEINIDLAEEALKDIISPNKPIVITPEYIISVVCEHFNIPENEIKSKKRNNDIVIPRHIIMYLCRQMTDASQTKIAQLLGKNDHTTVINGEKNIKKLLETDPSLNNTIETIKKKISPV
ncbi:MAG: chromosomal replication initiator protein DnaA [Lachnospiraceae bacterium]|nr:chromosomal replication initiator protein DnaA [Lachnospiraceae bacterium]